MESSRTQSLRLVLAAGLVWLATSPELSSAQGVASVDAASKIKFLELHGKVQINHSGSADWTYTTIDEALRAGDRLRTGENTRMVLKWSDDSNVPVGPLTELEIIQPHEPGAQFGLNLIRGILSFFHRDKPNRIRIITRGALAGVEGTEFVVAVETTNGTERTTMSVIDGRVRFYNDQGSLNLNNGQQAVAEVGKPPVRTAGFIANNLLQWCFYYPAVLDLRELPLTRAEETALRESLTAYQAGDLLGALDRYPKGRQPGSDAERLYHAELLLSLGQIDQTEAVLAALPAAPASGQIQRLATALRQLIAAVKRQANPSTLNPQLASEFLAASYYEQSLAVRETSLRTALDLARQAATNSPGFGFAWERVAELEFSFGRTERAQDALEMSLANAPRNAQALALKGFLLAAENKIREAIDWFNRAITLDSALGNAWLGRGLCRIRRGNLAGGREDLLVAAALEPQRALLRSYLSKAYSDETDHPRAAKELRLAKGLDKHDPTAWLYSALLNQEYNRINDAIGDLEQSRALNDNRSVYRSALLLDEDQAVRSANLAAIYRDAGMFDVSVQEASRAVSYDYANYSAHLFLANSYDQLRDPNRINLRFETPAESEYLIANLLAPVGAGTLAQSISQQDYSKLFEHDRLGVTSSTEYLSRGAWIEQGAQFGTFENSSYAFEASYRTDPGQRPNNDIEETELHLDLKQQLTPQDTLFLRAIYYNAQGGDLFQYYDQSSASPAFRYKETQEPMLFVGYHHEWSPGVQTIFLAGRFEDTFGFNDPRETVLIKGVYDGGVAGVVPINMNQTYSDQLEIYSTELQQIWQTPAHNTVAGLLGQWGQFHVMNQQDMPTDFFGLFKDPVTRQDFNLDFERLSVYGYHAWQIVEPLQVVGGLSYDRLTFPQNFRAAPLSDQTQTVDQLSPKAGLVWTPSQDTTLRFAYTRSLGGASLDQSFRLEPTQVAGFNQSFRSIIPESVVGANAGAHFETYGLSLEQKFPTRTYLGLSGEILNSNERRTVGAFEQNSDVSDFVFASSLRENLDFGERSLIFTLNQLLGEEWSLGARYRVTKAQLNDNFPEVPSTANISPPFQQQQQLDAVLHQLNLVLTYNHPSGFFAEFQALWNLQSNHGYQPAEPGDEFWQFNAFAGYRFPRRKAQLTLGVLNLTDRDYRLDPLTLYNELPRTRTFIVRLQFNF